MKAGADTNPSHRPVSPGSLRITRTFNRIPVVDNVELSHVTLVWPHPDAG